MTIGTAQASAETAAPARELIPLSAVQGVNAARRPRVQLERPWASWPTPEPIPCSLRDLHLQVTVDGKLFLNRRSDSNVNIAVPHEGLKAISYFAQFPTDFVEK